MGVTTALLVVGATIVFVILKWWFSASGQLYRDKSIPVPSGEIAIFFSLARFLNVFIVKALKIL